MAFSAILKIGTRDNIELLKCDFILRKDVDHLGRPASVMYGGIINLAIEATGDTVILELMADQFKSFDGWVIFKKRDEDSKMKELIWEKGYIVMYREGVDITGTNPMFIEFTISAEKIKIGNVEHRNPW